MVSISLYFSTHGCWLPGTPDVQRRADRALAETARLRIGRHTRRLYRAHRNMRDRVEISPDAVYRFAAREFDPRRTTPVDAESLIDLLFDGGAIEPEDRRAMRRALEDPAGSEPSFHNANYMRTLAILRLVDCRRPGART